MYTGHPLLITIQEVIAILITVEEAIVHHPIIMVAIVVALIEVLILEVIPGLVAVAQGVQDPLEVAVVVVAEDANHFKQSNLVL